VSSKFFTNEGTNSLLSNVAGVFPLAPEEIALIEARLPAKPPAD